MNPITLSTHEMILDVHYWLHSQTSSTPRDTLTALRDMAVSILAPLNPPSGIPAVGVINLTQPQTIALIDNWVSAQEHLTSEQFVTQLRDGCNMVIRALPVPVPIPTPIPTPTPAGPQIRAAMFMDASGSPYSETINTGVTSPQAWASSHGKSWENGYRADILDRLQAVGSDTMVYIVDGYLGDPKTSVLAICLADMGHPDDGRHADQSEGWYDRCKAKGVIRHIAILRDSPDTKVPATKQSVANLVAYYKGSRFDVIYLTGLECNRNRTVAQTVQDVKWLQELAPGKRVLAGSADPNYLLAVADGAPGVELWLEQADSLMAKPLTLATAPTYLASLDRLAAKVGVGRVWGGEYWLTNINDRRTVTQQILSRGMSCGCGVFK